MTARRHLVRLIAALAVVVVGCGPSEPPQTAEEVLAVLRTMHDDLGAIDGVTGVTYTTTDVTLGVDVTGIIRIGLEVTPDPDVVQDAFDEAAALVWRSAEIRSISLVEVAATDAQGRQLRPSDSGLYSAEELQERFGPRP